jgi:hypothetical protein
MPGIRQLSAETSGQCGDKMLDMSQQLRPFCPGLFVFALLCCTQSAVSQVPHRFALDQFGDFACRAKGRLQDCSTGNPITRQVLATGKRSIPVLISQLTETARTEEPIIDFWAYTTSGDVAFMFLTDLFTDKDGESFTMPGVSNWEKIMSGCNGVAEACWRRYVRKNGIRSVQQSWQAAWETNQNRIIWDPASRCFRLHK